MSTWKRNIAAPSARLRLGWQRFPRRNCDWNTFPSIFFDHSLSSGSGICSDRNEAFLFIGGLFCSWAPQNLYTKDGRKFDVNCWKLLRRVVGPPPDIDWSQPWHTILHAWHSGIDQQLEYHGFNQGMVSEISFRGLEICKVRCSTS